MDILNDIYLLVELYNDTLKKYKIICKMDFYNRVIDVRTGREIFIEGMYEEETNKGLCCKNTFIPIDKDRVDEIINNDDINEYNDYLDDIERKNIKRRVRRKK